MEEGSQSTSVSTRSFVAARVNEVIALSKEIQHQGGLESKGLAFQHVPKHMRRRAVSHNTKRLPKRLQSLHDSQSKKSGGLNKKPKRPSSKHRKRKAGISAALVFKRRQLSVKWIETHVWHAKRFHMEKKWGYKIPIRPTDKSYRAIYRGFSKYSTVQDISYYSCLELSGDFALIVERMKELIPAQVNHLSLHAQYYLRHFREGVVHIYKRGRYPFGYIGPVSFFWNASSTALWMWVHPSYKFELLTELINLFDLEDIQIPKTTPQSNASVPEGPWRRGNVVTLTNLEGRLNRFRLSGPETTKVLQNLLRVRESLPSSPLHEANDCQIPDEMCRGDEPSLSEAQAKIWNGTQDYSDYPSNIVVPLTVRDPRIFATMKRAKLNGDRMPKEDAEFDYENFQTMLLEHCGANQSPLWSEEGRTTASEQKIPDSEIASKRKEMLIPGLDLELGEKENQIPIILVHKPEQLGGWDLILPADWAMPFWLGLSFRCVRAIGHRDALHLTFSKITSNQDDGDSILHSSLSANLFPQDSASGQEEMKLIEDQVQATYFRLPPAKRNHFQQLACPFPFHIDWVKFLQFWQSRNCDSSTVPIPIEELFVLRDFKLFQVLREKLKTENLLRGSSLLSQELNSFPPHMGNCLIPIYVTSLGRGKPTANAVLCVPTVDDLEKLLANSLSECKEEMYPREPEPDKKQLNEIEARKTELWRKHRKHLALLRKKRKKEIDACNRLQIRFERSESKYDSAGVCAKYNQQKDAMFTPDDPVTVLNHMSRCPIGFITFGSESYKIGRGAGTGYVSVGGFWRMINFYQEYINRLRTKEVPDKEIVTLLQTVILIRDAKASMTYRYAQLHII